MRRSGSGADGPQDAAAWAAGPGAMMPVPRWPSAGRGPRAERLGAFPQSRSRTAVIIDALPELLRLGGFVFRRFSR